jgi:AraC family ethanolamine operon transcriptional activator
MPPAPQWRATQTMGVDQLAQSITGWQQVYDQTSPGRFCGALTELMLGPMQVFMESSSHALVQTCKLWSGAVWFGIPAASHQIGRVDGAKIESGMLALHAGPDDFQLTTPDNFGFLGIVVQSHWLAQYAEGENSVLPANLFKQRVLEVDATALDPFRHWLFSMVTSGGPTAQALAPAAQDHFADEVLSGLVQLLTRGKGGTKDSVPSQHARRTLRRVRDYLHAHSDRSVTVHELCEQLGSSPRALQDCFQKYTGLSPKTYLRTVGLNAVRRELQRQDATSVTVSDVATRFGFWHLSQFATDYRRLFGELPSETLRQRHA